MRKHLVITTFILILLLGIFLRFYLISDVPPGLYPDEAMNGNNALEALSSGHFKVFYPENNGREGLFINIQALSIKLFGHTPWALRVVSALFGTLTILGVYLLSRELFPGRDALALLSSFFIATSYWHINFSRISFRAISVPFFASFTLFFLIRGFRRKNIWDFVAAGIFAGLGLQTYIAFRFMPFVIVVPLLFALINWWKGHDNPSHTEKNTRSSITCAPCAIMLFALVVLVVVLPIGLYFLQHPADFFGRSGQVSIFSGASPIKEFIISNAATLGMFFVRGDCNFRHNFSCMPEMHPIAAFFLLLGILYAIRGIFKKNTDRRSLILLSVWFIFMMFPATLTREGLPHALRSIGLIPPVMILAGFGAWQSVQIFRNFFERQKTKWPQFSPRIKRIQRELLWVVIFVILFIPLATYDTYFLRWRNNVNTYFAFATDLWHLGQYLNTLSPDIKKYVVVNLPGTDVRGIPMSAQTIMYATDSFREKSRKEKNIVYVLPHEINAKIFLDKNGKVLVTFLNSQDRALTAQVQKKFPGLRVWVPGDFAILKNY